MNYERIYNELVLHAQQQDTPSIKEVHHIVPRSMGGSDSPCNLVSFTPRQHFVAHRLLAKFTQGVDKYKMLSAVVLMSGRGTINKSSRSYARLREERITYMKQYKVEETGAEDLYFPFSILGKEVRTIYDKAVYHLSITKKAKYNRYRSGINLCYVLAKLGYKGYSSASINQFKKLNEVLIELGFVTKEVNGSKVNYSFTEKYLTEVASMHKMFSITHINKILIKNPLRKKGSGSLIKSISEWNHNNPLKLIQYVSCDNSIRKVNAWKGELPNL